MKTFSPLFKVLSSEGIAQIDQTARMILEEVGVRIYDRATLDMLKSAGAQIDEDNLCAHFASSWLDEAITKAPTQFTLYSRDQKNNVELGTGRVYFANGGRVFRILDTKTGAYRLTLLKDVADTAAVVDRLDHISLYIIACQAHDLEMPYYHLNDFYQAMNHTTKHVMGGCDTLEGVRQMWQLACFVAGGEDKFHKKPFVSVITNPISPLMIDSEALAVLKFCCTHGIPVTCAPASISGATAPITLAGTLAQMHAEALAGVAIAQTIFPGARVLYGAVLSNMDLREMQYTMGSVEMAIMNAAAVHLAKRYNLPIYASGGVTDSKRSDLQAGCEKSFSNLMVALAGADLVHLAAGMLDSGNTISYEQFLIDNEILGMTRRILAGISVTEESLGAEIIKNVGHGGNYVMEDHTVDHMLEEFFYTNLSVRCNFDVWERSGRPDMVGRAKAMVEEILRDGHKRHLTRDITLAIEKKFAGIRSI